MQTAKNILLHELIGLQCEVVNAKNKAQIGLRGKIIDETMKTVTINGKRVFKCGSIFRLAVTGKKIDVDGNYLLARPEDRIKKKLKKW